VTAQPWLCLPCTPRAQWAICRCCTGSSAPSRCAAIRALARTALRYVTSYAMRTLRAALRCQLGSARVVCELQSVLPPSLLSAWNRRFEMRSRRRVNAFLAPCHSIRRCRAYGHMQFGNSALLTACWNGHVDVVRWLVDEMGADYRNEKNKVIRTIVGSRWPTHPTHDLCSVSSCPAATAVYTVFQHGSSHCVAAGPLRAGPLAHRGQGRGRARRTERGMCPLPMGQPAVLPLDATVVVRVAAFPCNVTVHHRSSTS
jgi:hypothetical protein